VTVNPASYSTDVGHNLRIVGTVLGANGSATVRWAGMPAGCGPANGLTLNCTPTTVGSYELFLWANDTHGHTGRSSAVALQVYPLPSVTVVESAHEGALPLTIRFVANVTGGDPPLAYNWSIRSSVVGDAPTLDWTFQSYGKFRVELNVSDAAGVVASANASVAVIVPLVGSLRLPSGSVPVGSLVNVSANLTGGEPPYSVNWLLNDSAFPIVNQSRFDFVPRSPGIYRFTALIRDSVNDSTQLTGVLHASTSQAANPFASSGVWVWVLVLGASGAAVGLAVVLLRRTSKPPARPGTA
jgi:hypothetical protein